MSEISRIYRVNAPTGIDDLVQQMNRLLGLLADRLDQIEGYRGAITFHGDIDMDGHSILSATIDGATLNNPVMSEFGEAQHTHESDDDGGQLDHGAALTGLSDDDHSQYVLADGTRDIDFSSGNIKVGNVTGSAYVSVDSDGNLTVHDSTGMLHGFIKSAL